MQKMLRRIFNLRGNLGGLFGDPTKNDPYNQIAPPSFQPDQSYTNASQQLATLGTNILSGNLPSYYSNLGKPNSPQFQALEKNVVGQTNQASAEQAAASGTDRSGVAATAAAGSLANILPSMSYNDYLNAQQQQGGLLSLGSQITQNVGQMGLTNQAQTNQFAQNKFNEQIDLTGLTDQWNKEAAQAQGQAQANVFGDVVDVAAAPFTGGMSLAGLNLNPMGSTSVGGAPSSSQTATSGGTNTGLNFSALLNGLGNFFNPSPASSAMSGFPAMVGNAVGGGF